jgi:hypothetical protein
MQSACDEVTKRCKGSILIAGIYTKGNGLNQLSSPHGVVVDQLGTVFMTDHCHHQVIRWLKAATQGSVVGGKYGPDEQANQLYHSIGLSLDKQNHIFSIIVYYQK